MTVVVMLHRSRACRGRGPDSFAPMLESEPALSGRVIGWTWSDDPVWEVEVCRECNFATGKQCESCAAIRAAHRKSGGSE